MDIYIYWLVVSTYHWFGNILLTMVNINGYYVIIRLMMVNNDLVSGFSPTPLKNDGIRQLGL